MQGTGDRSLRKQLVERTHPQLSVRRQCELLGVNRNRLAASPQGGLSEADLQLARRIDEVHLSFPEFGARRMKLWLGRENWQLTRSRVGQFQAGLHEILGLRRDHQFKGLGGQTGLKSIVDELGP